MRHCIRGLNYCKIYYKWFVNLDYSTY
jgi:hypothetical protein